MRSLSCSIAVTPQDRSRCVVGARPACVSLPSRRVVAFGGRRSGDRRRALGARRQAALLGLRRRRRVGLVALRRRPACVRPLRSTRRCAFAGSAALLAVVGADRRLAFLGALGRRVGRLGLDGAARRRAWRAWAATARWRSRRRPRRRRRLLDRLLLEALAPGADRASRHRATGRSASSRRLQAPR